MDGFLSPEGKIPRYRRYVYNDPSFSPKILGVDLSYRL